MVCLSLTSAFLRKKKHLPIWLQIIFFPFLVVLVTYFCLIPPKCKPLEVMLPGLIYQLWILRFWQDLAFTFHSKTGIENPKAPESRAKHVKYEVSMCKTISGAKYCDELKTVCLEQQHLNQILNTGESSPNYERLGLWTINLVLLL